MNFGTSITSRIPLVAVIFLCCYIKKEKDNEVGPAQIDEDKQNLVKSTSVKPLLPRTITKFTTCVYSLEEVSDPLEGLSAVVELSSYYGW